MKGKSRKRKAIINHPQRMPSTVRPEHREVATKCPEGHFEYRWRAAVQNCQVVEGWLLLVPDFPIKRQEHIKHGSSVQTLVYSDGASQSRQSDRIGRLPTWTWMRCVSEMEMRRIDSGRKASRFRHIVRLEESSAEGHGK